MSVMASLVVPAFNEAPRMKPVLRCATESGLFSKIVVVDDGSADETANVAGEFPVEVLRHERNLGKGAALQTGLNYLDDPDVAVFLDADLTGVTGDHLETLIRSAVDVPGMGMTVARFIEGRWMVDMQQKWFAILNGQRALTRKFLRLLPDMSWSRFGVEVLMTRLARDLKVPVHQVLWSGISHHTKEEKFGAVPGFGARLNMYRECLWAYAVYASKVAAHLTSLRDGPAVGETEAVD